MERSFGITSDLHGKIEQSSYWSLNDVKKYTMITSAKDPL